MQQANPKKGFTKKQVKSLFVLGGACSLALWPLYAHMVDPKVDVVSAYALSIFMLGLTLDHWTTTIALKLGAQELNPLYNMARKHGFSERGALLAMGVMGAICGLIVFILEIPTIMMLFAALIMTGPVFNTFQMTLMNLKRGDRPNV
jgi:hypothetical protein